jgi:hypothetical protein
MLLSIIFVSLQLNLNTPYNNVQDNAAEIKFDKTTHDFGKVKKGAKDVKCKFKYTNIGTDVLFITRIVKSCGCTEPVYSKQPLMPGQSADIEVGYTTTDAVGVFNKKLTVFSNATTESVIITIKGEVIP